MSTKKSEKIKDDFIIMKKLIKQKLDEWDTGDIQNEINKISILEDKPRKCQFLFSSNDCTYDVILLTNAVRPMSNCVGVRGAI